MGNTKNTGYLQNIVQYDASNNITLPAKLTIASTVAINNTTPYDTTQYSLDVNGGLLVKNVGRTAQFVLINSNPASGGNNAFVVHTVGGTSGSSYADIQGYYGTSITGSTVLRLNPLGGNVLIGSLIGTGTRVVVADATGVLSTQAAQTFGDLNGVPTSRTITINGTTYDLSANRSWSITSMIYPGAGIAVSTGTAWGTSITDNSANWNLAYGWGNHAGLYSLLNHTHTFASLTSKPTTLVGYGITDAATSAQGTSADTAYGWGNHGIAGYLTGITSGQVTTALGFTPYNATNPTGYITSAALSTYATQTYVGTAIANLVASSPAALDTLNELAAALGNDAAFSTTVSTALGNRLRVDINTQGLSATLQGYGRTNLGLGTAATSNTGDFVAYRTFGTAANNNTGDFAAASHTHSIANVTGLQTALDGKQASGSYAASSHSHIISDVTGLQTALDGKQASLGFTPYNSTNPSGYISSYTETDTLASVTARGATTSTAVSFTGGLTVGTSTVDSNFPFYVTGATTTSRYSLTNMGMGFNLSDSYAQLQLYGTAGAYIDFQVSASQDYSGRILYTSASGFNISAATTFASTISASNFSGTHSGSSSGTNTGDQTNISGTANNITAYTINQSVGTGNAPSFAGASLTGSLYLNSNNDVTSLAGSLTLYSTGNATTSMIMFKNTTGLGYGNHGAITGGYNTYFVMDTTDRGWIWRNATTSTNIASISNTGALTVNGSVYQGASNQGVISLLSDINVSQTNNYYRLYVPQGYVGYTQNGGMATIRVVWGQGHAGITYSQEFKLTFGTNHGAGGNYLHSSEVTRTYKDQNPESYGGYVMDQTPAVDFYQDISGGYINFNVKGYHGQNTHRVVSIDITGGGTSTPTLTYYGATSPGGSALTVKDIPYASTSGTASNITAYTINQSVGSSNAPTFAGITINGQTTINRHIDANTGWGSASGNTIFVGWSGGKVVLGSNANGGHDYARDITVASVVSTNPFFCFQDITAFSDSRVKENVQVVDNALDKIKAIRGVTFTRNDTDDTNKRHVGVIAQEVLAVLPEAVSKDDRGYYSVAYGNMAALFIEAIKEQQGQIESQKSEIDELKDLVQQLINR